MKKTIGLLLLACICCVTLFSCTNTGNSSTTGEVSSKENTSSIGEVSSKNESKEDNTPSTLPADNDSSAPGDNDGQGGVGGSINYLLRPYEVRYYDVLNVLYILSEREWKENCEAKYNMTWDEAYAERSSKFPEIEKIEHLKVFEEVMKKVDEKLDKDYMEESSFNSPDLYWLINKYNITKEEFVRFNDKDKERLANAKENHPDTNWHDDTFTDQEINTLFSKDVRAVKAMALNDYALMVGDKVFSAQWLLDHSVEDYQKEGISLALVKEKTQAIKDSKMAYEDELVKMDAKVDQYAKKAKS